MAQDRLNWKISDYIEHGWTQKAEARDLKGQPVTFASPIACFWCVNGAIAACAVKLPFNLNLSRELFNLTVRKIKDKQPLLALWNDMLVRRKCEVLALVREAEQEAKAELFELQTKQKLDWS